MQITPRYEGRAVLQLDMHGDPAMPLLRQRRRLGELLATLDVDQWAAPSRCEDWSVQDVIAHLVSTNQFWTVSLGAGIAGHPTHMLVAFDPVATPAQLVDATLGLSWSEILDQYLQTVDELANVVTGLDDAAWSMPAEAPPGHLAAHTVALHALWDAWIHERDIMLPLGLTPTVEPDEVVASLRYAAAIGPALRASAGSTLTGTLGVLTSDPEASFVVEAGTTVVVADTAPAPETPCLAGDAVTLLEGLSFRAPLAHRLSNDDAWLLAGLGEVFERAR